MNNGFGHSISKNLSAGGTISGDVTISGDLTVTGSSTYSYTEAISGTGTAKANFDILTLTNAVNAADMDGTETSVLFNQYYYDGSTPAVADAGRISIGTETDWTSTASTQDSYMAFETALNGTVTEYMRISSAGTLTTKNIEASNSSGNTTISVSGGTDEGDARLLLKADAGAVNADWWEIRSDASDNNLYFKNGNDERVVISATGKVGIGNTVPGELFEISKSAGDAVAELSCWSTNAGHQPRLVFTKSASATINILAATAAGEDLGRIVAQGVNASSAANESAGIFFEGDAAPDGDAVPGRISFWTSDAATFQERMRIDDAGNVGIGVAAPHNLIEIAADGAAAIATLARKDSSPAIVDDEELGRIEFSGYDSDNTYAVGAKISGRANGVWASSNVNYAGTDLEFFTQDNTSSDNSLSTPRMVITSTGNVGIGIAAPSRNLEVRGSSSSAITIRAGDTSSAASLLFGDTDADNVGGIAYSNSAHSLTFSTAGITRMVIDGNSRISLSNNDSGTSNTIFGHTAGDSDGAGDYNVFIGELAGGHGTQTDACDSNVGIGYDSLNNLTTGDRNTAVGRDSLLALTDGQYNVAIGYDAGTNLDGGTHNVIIGDSAGITTTLVDKTVLIGQGAGAGALDANADGTVAIGHNSLGALTSGVGNTAVGYLSLDAATTDDYNTAVGYQALSGVTGDNDNHNTGVGYNAGLYVTTGVQNTFVGSLSGQALIGTPLLGDGNTALGFSAGWLLQGAAHKNTIVGAYAGDVLTTGSDNTCIGQNADTDDATAVNQTVIGHDTTGVADNTVTLGNAAVTAVYMAQDATSDYTTNTHGATVYAGGLHLKKSQVAHDSGGITSPLVVHNSYDDSPDSGQGVGIDLVMSDEIDNYGAVTGRIGQIKASGDIGSGGAGFSSSMQFFNIADGTLRKQLALNGDDGNYNTTIFAATLSSAVRYGLYVENDGNDANCYGMQIKAGKDDGTGSTTYINCADGNGDQIGHISHISDTFALTNVSDRRLKKNIVDTTLKGVETVDKMKVRDFEWIKSGNKTKASFIAQELIDAFPSAVNGEDGAMEDILDEDGNKTGERIKPMGVSRDVLVPVLIKAVQELSARVKELEEA